MQQKPSEGVPRLQQMNGMYAGIKLLCIGAWMLELLLTVYYNIGLSKSFHIGAVDVSKEVALRQDLMYGWIAVGLSLALAALGLKKWWPIAVIASSLTYLLEWYCDGPMSSVGFYEGYRLQWQTASHFGLYLAFSVRDVIVPIVLTVSLLGGLVQISRSAVRGLVSRP